MPEKTLTPSTEIQISRLRALGNHIQIGIQEYIHCLQQKESDANPDALPSHQLLDARKSLCSLAARLNSAVLPPKEQLVLLSSQHIESRVLHTIVAADIAGIISRNGNERVAAETLAYESGLEVGKLSKLLLFLYPSVNNF